VRTARGQAITAPPIKPMKSRHSPKGALQALIASYYPAILRLEWVLLENCVLSWDDDVRVGSSGVTAIAVDRRLTL
jgi:hypothetical protein